MTMSGLPPGTPPDLTPPWAQGPQGTEGRMKQGQLTFAATMAAVTGSCACQACKLLRKAIAVMTEELTQELEQDAPGVPPPA